MHFHNKNSFCFFLESPDFVPIIKLRLGEFCLGRAGQLIGKKEAQQYKIENFTILCTSDENLNLTPEQLKIVQADMPKLQHQDGQKCIGFISLNDSNGACDVLYAEEGSLMTNVKSYTPEAEPEAEPGPEPEPICCPASIAIILGLAVGTVLGVGVGLGVFR